MKNVLTILTILIVISCSKNNDNTKPIDNSNKTIKELVTQNEWVFKQGSVLRLSGTTSSTDTVVKFNVDSTMRVFVYQDNVMKHEFPFTYTNYVVRNDSVYGTLVYLDRDFWDDSLFYSMKRVDNDLVGTKIESFHWSSGYIRKLPVNVRIGIR